MALVQHPHPLLRRLIDQQRKLRRRFLVHNGRPPNAGPPLRPLGLQPVPPPGPQSTTKNHHHPTSAHHPPPRNQLQNFEDLGPVHVQRRDDRLQRHPGQRAQGRRPPQGEGPVAAEAGQRTPQIARPSSEEGAGGQEDVHVQFGYLGEDRRDGGRELFGREREEGAEGEAVGAGHVDRRQFAVPGDQGGAHRMERAGRGRDGDARRWRRLQQRNGHQARSGFGRRKREGRGAVLAFDLRTLFGNFYSSSRMGEAYTNTHRHVAGQKTEAGKI